MSLLTDADLAIASDPLELISRFTIKSKAGPRVTFDDPFPEQVMLLRDWWDPRRHAIRYHRTTVAKGRQQGIGEVTQAFMVAYCMQAEDPLGVFITAHDEKTAKVHIARPRSLMESLPGPLRGASLGGAQDEWVWNNKTKWNSATFLGKAGKAQGLSNHLYHGTECGMYGDIAPTNETMGSIEATMDEESPHLFIVKESTSNGPGSWWQWHVENARQPNSGENFRFFPCSINPMNRKSFDSDAARSAFIDGMGAEEEKVIAQHAAYVASLKPWEAQLLANAGTLTLTPEFFHWRKTKKGHKDMFLFAHDFPMTVDEAFLSGGLGYFDGDRIDEQRKRQMRPEVTRWGAEVWEAPQSFCRYVVALDPSEGVGQDYHVITVLNHRLEQCLVWADNKSDQAAVGELAVRIAAQYGDALLIIESNRGREALKAANRLNYGNIYHERPGSEGITTWGNRVTVDTGMGGKDELFGHARTQLNARRVTIRDPLTLSELGNIRKSATGRISGADKKHDDRAMAWVLAVWAARRIENFVVERTASIIERFGLHEGQQHRTTPFG